MGFRDSVSFNTFQIVANLSPRRNLSDGRNPVPGALQWKRYPNEKREVEEVSEIMARASGDYFLNRRLIRLWKGAYDVPSLDSSFHTSESANKICDVMTPWHLCPTERTEKTDQTVELPRSPRA